jgi:spore coat protein CotF
MEEMYTDKDVLNDALTAEKTATNNYNTFANECVHDNVREVVLKCLAEEHTIQNQVFNEMHTRGMYPTPEAEQQKVEEAKQKYSCCAK